MLFHEGEPQNGSETLFFVRVGPGKQISDAVSALFAKESAIQTDPGLRLSVGAGS
jgi:hypothetical protein